MTKKVSAIIGATFLSIFLFSSQASANYYEEGTTLRIGDRGSNVIHLQDDLKRLGYFNYNSTGYFGSITYQAVQKFQKDNGLGADGIVGKYTARELKVEKVLKTAWSYYGVPYVWGGVSPSGFDCSGFTHYTMLNNNITIPRTSSEQYKAGTWVDKSQLKEGDMVFFTTYKPGPSHVGIYVGNNKFIHGSSGAGKVITSDLNSPYYTTNYIGSKRVIK